MRTLEQKKLLTIIAALPFKNIIIDTLRARGVGGYTMMDAQGVGAFGIQAGSLQTDTSLLIHVILSEARLNLLLVDLDELMNREYRFKVIITDIAILPRKPSVNSA